MSKQEQKNNFTKEESRNETSGLKKLVKKVLTDKTMRNAATMSAFVATVANVGLPWMA
jgi:hypothetical protein